MKKIACKPEVVQFPTLLTSCSVLCLGYNLFLEKKLVIAFKKDVSRKGKVRSRVVGLQPSNANLGGRKSKF